MRILCATVLLSLVFPALVPAQNAAADAPPKTTPEIEKIVHEYLLKHPEVIIEAVNKYQENQRNDEKKKAELSILSHKGQLVSDPASPVGGADAKDAVTVVEFFDYRCGYCKKMAPAIAKYVNGSKIHLVYKEFPILGPDSAIASKAALAARKQGDYVKFHQGLMALQGTITMAQIEKVATADNLDFAKLKADMESPEIQAQISLNQGLASAIGVNATPSFVIGNELITGMMDDQEFQAAIAKVKR